MEFLFYIAATAIYIGSCQMSIIEKYTTTTEATATTITPSWVYILTTWRLFTTFVYNFVPKDFVLFV